MSQCRYENVVRGEIIYCQNEALDRGGLCRQHGVPQAMSRDAIEIVRMMNRNKHNWDFQRALVEKVAAFAAKYPEDKS